jgi:hypothetical protein
LQSSVKPNIPFIGVLISWLILARKANFNRSLSSACSLALTNSSARFSFYFEGKFFIGNNQFEARFSFFHFENKFGMAMISSAAFSFRYLEKQVLY